ncbi:STAS domain-containing protein [Micromonospora sp. BQ11]|uniref:STAS domain-containing protein n=1 Tax=Micromonospora sp. BQ11 TaxID=3452212 RepID=UPI003F895906
MSTLEQPTRPQARPAKPIMALALDSEGPAALITVRGEVDMSTAHLIAELAEHAITRRPARLVLDLSRVTFFSAHGISVLLQTHDAASSAGVPLALHDPAPCVTHLLTATGTPMAWDVSTSTPTPGRDGAARIGRLSPRPCRWATDTLWQEGRQHPQTA